jgi:hypothetical protein
MTAYDFYLKNPLSATRDIAPLLANGSLTLFLGAGLSVGFGIPNWTLLVARLLGKGDDIDFLEHLKTLSDKELARLADDVDSEDVKFRAAVHKALYPNETENLSEQLTKSPLLLAVTALMTGTRRGRIKTVFTYNYDDLLETYLSRLGLAAAPRCVPTELERWSDVEINHLHGFLPRVPNPEVDQVDQIVLSAKSFRKRRAEIDAGWSAVMQEVLKRSIGLFVGLSGDDDSILDVIQRSQVKGREEPYSGYWLMTPAAFQKNGSTILGLGMCPIRLEESQFPVFLFDICEGALVG